MEDIYKMINNKSSFKTSTLLISIVILSIPSLFILIVLVNLFSFQNTQLYSLYENYPHYILFISIICSTPILFFKLWNSQTKINLALQLLTRVLLAAIYVTIMHFSLQVILMLDVVIPAFIKAIAH